MLAKTARLTKSGDFARATKSGIRYSSANFVGYLYINSDSNESARAGLIIGKSVGGSVVRHRLARKMRHCLREEYSNLQPGALLVLRCLNNSSETDYPAEVIEVIKSLLKKAYERAAKR